MLWPVVLLWRCRIGCPSAAHELSRVGVGGVSYRGGMTPDVVVEQVFHAQCRTCGTKVISVLDSENECVPPEMRIARWATDHECPPPKEPWYSSLWPVAAALGIVFAAMIVAALIVGALTLTGVIS